MTRSTYSGPRQFLTLLLVLSPFVGGCAQLSKWFEGEQKASPEAGPSGDTAAHTSGSGGTPAGAATPATAKPVASAESGGTAGGLIAPLGAKPEKELAPPTNEPLPPHEGPWLWVRRSSAGIYEAPTTKREGKIGYVKRGGKVAILEEKLEAPGCSGGWYRVRTGGVICNQVGSTDPNSSIARFTPRQPDTEAILPYPYARNAKNGTPAYKSLPSRAQMYEYEPYLPEAQKAKEALAEEKKRDFEQMREAGLSLGGSGPVGTGPMGTGPIGTGPHADIPAPEVPLWEREDNLHEVTLDDLRKEADDIMAQRMMKGFYVAIDKTFKWNGRSWYKTTKGVVTPADRFWQTAGSDFHGVELDGEKWSLPIGFVVGARKSTPIYQIDDETNQRTPTGSLKKFEPIALQYSYKKIGDIEYYQMADGQWVRDAHTRVTTPGPRPAEVGPDEVWVDVDISEQTLVVFRGDTPLYATLISSGKESRDKEKDHSTPRGMWRVREKHTVSTMDGNGTAAGDLPYSIEDVPYIMYFHKSYATHGAFWHQNYGYQMSHGCINLAPLDAKWVFLNAAPYLPEGMHGAWSSDSRPGSMIVVHD